MHSQQEEKWVFIINPISGKKKKDFVPDSIQEFFREEKIKTKIKFTKYPGHARKIVKKQLKKGATTLVAVGGDGTVNEVAGSLIGSDIPLGIIPLGSGNGLARHLGIPLRINRALELLKQNTIRQIDYGLINEKIPFFCTCGLGFDAHVGHKFSVSKERGFISYVKTTLGEYWKYKPKKYRINLNGKTIKKRAFLVTFANAAQYGNNAYVAPEADITDGQMDISILSPFPPYLALGIARRLFGKSIDKSPFMKTLRTNRATVKIKKKTVLHYDGEPTGIKPGKLKISIVNKGLVVIVPKSFNG